MLAHFNNLDGQRYERAAIDRLNIRVVLGGSETIISSGNQLLDNVEIYYMIR